MSFTATISSVNLQDDQWKVVVNFADSATGWQSNRAYSFPSNETQAQAVAQITADGTAYKANLATLNALQTKVGSVIII